MGILMGKNHLRPCVPAVGLFLWLMAAFSARCVADTLIYNDGVWIVNGADEADPGLNRIGVSLAGQPVGRFTELKVFRSFGGGFPQIFTIQANGGLQPAVPPSGDFGGTFHLTRYWDCFAGLQPDLRITTLNIQPNSKKFNTLNFNGNLSNATSLQATDLTLQLVLPDNDTVRLAVRYTLYATRSICVDPWRQQYGEGFQVARIASNYISSQIHDNDGAKVNGVAGVTCDCCGCFSVAGHICASFFNAAAYVFPFPIRMKGPTLLAVNWQPGAQNTAALRIVTKRPSPPKSSVQGVTVFSTDPTADNVNLWLNWPYANSQYTPGQKVGMFRFSLEATLPESTSCDFVVP